MADWQNPIGSTPDYSMSLQGLSGSLNNNVATWRRAKQRGFDAAAAGDLGDSLSEGMARPEDDMLTEALTEKGATVSPKFGLPGTSASPEPDFTSLNSLSNSQLLSHQGMSPAQFTALQALQGLGPRRRLTQGTTSSTPIEQ